MRPACRRRAAVCFNLSLGLVGVCEIDMNISHGEKTTEILIWCARNKFLLVVFLSFEGPGLLVLVFFLSSQVS